MGSPIDKIFEDIFGYAPAKKGIAFERLAAIATHLCFGGEVKHGDRLRGEFSETLYEIDVHRRTEDGNSMGEAKDYSDQDEKVGRGDLQKLGGALPDLKSITDGKFFSATGYTKPAKKYAESAEDITGKPIALYGLRPSTETDERGFIKTIIIEIVIIWPELERSKWLPRITQKGEEALRSLLEEGEDEVRCQIGVQSFYDEQGNEILSLQELTSHGYGHINQETGKSHACFLLTNHFIKTNDGVLVEVHGLEYELPYSYHRHEIRITDDSEHRFVLLDGDGNVLKILTDKMLRNYEFDEAGNLMSLNDFLHEQKQAQCHKA